MFRREADTNLKNQLNNLKSRTNDTDSEINNFNNKYNELYRMADGKIRDDKI